ncbi:hypothetical protein N7488_005258 [Penicillium malachiteum]|nr:hypothetical protein N7488_005258 [Penicillium malachiteum]
MVRILCGLNTVSSWVGVIWVKRGENRLSLISLGRYHAYDLYKFLGGIEDWIYATAGVWFFDRLARIARIVICGPRRATVTEIGEGYLWIDVAGIRWGCDPGKHVYVYSPTLNPLRPWENHTFSVLPTALLSPLSSKSMASGTHTPRSLSRDQEGTDVEKTNGMTPNIKALAGHIHPSESHSMSESLKA